MIVKLEQESLCPFKSLVYRSEPFHNLLDLYLKRDHKSEGKTEEISSEIKSIWTAATSNGQKDNLSKRLDWDNLDPRKINNYLQSKEPTEWANYYKDHFDSSWLKKFNELSTWLKDSWDMPLKGTSKDNRQELAFIDIWLPIQKKGLEIIYNYSKDISADIRVNKRAINDLCYHLIERLVYISEKTLWLKFNEERPPGIVLKAWINTDVSSSRGISREYYKEFICKHRRDGLHSLTNEFPVLARLIGTVYGYWIESSKELVRRLYYDDQAIREVFGIDAKAKIVSIQPGLSDPHRNGRSVAIIGYLTQGSIKQLVYKPKELRIDAVYQDLLGFINKSSCDIPFKLLKIICKDGYGFVEHVSQEFYRKPNDLKEFYRNAGRLTSVLQILGCTDCHYENLISNSKQLILIDTETLFDAIPAEHISQDEDLAHSDIAKLFRKSVLKTGLLPNWQFIGEDKIPADISALGILPPAARTEPQIGWLELNTDNMRKGLVDVEAKIPPCIPINIGESNQLANHLDEFCAGFREQCQIIISLRNIMLSNNGIFSAFIGLPKRIVIRPTRVYLAIQRQQLDPTALRSSIQQAMKLEQLTKAYLLSIKRPANWQIFKSEVKQMQALDVPFFSNNTDSRNLTTHIDGYERFIFARESGISNSIELLSELNNEEIDFQLNIIRGCILAREAPHVDHSAETITHRTGKCLGEERQNNLNATKHLAEKLLKGSIQDKYGNITWLGMKLDSNGERFSFGPVGLSLYSGSIGIACLLARLCNQGVKSLTDDKTNYNLPYIIESILRPLVKLTYKPNDNLNTKWWNNQVIGLNGSGGVLMALNVLIQENLDIPKTNIKMIVDHLVDGIDESFLSTNEAVDIISGSSGLIGPLLRINSEKANAIAYMLGEKLVNSQLNDGGWITVNPNQALLGFSHGAAGITTALAKLHSKFCDKSFLEAAHRGLTYERSLYSEEYRNWPDFRLNRNGSSTTQKFMTSWCHGAPGLALARSCLWETELWSKEAELEISIALETMLTIKQHKYDHLCCGSLGIVTLMRILTNGPWSIPKPTIQYCQDYMSRESSNILERICNDSNLRCFGTEESNLILPGFFNGLSGMGMAILNNPKANSYIKTFLSAGL